MPIPTIMENLRVTRSVEQTVENIIDGRLVAPPLYREETPHPQLDTTALLQTLSEPTTSRSWDDEPTDNVDT